MNRYPIMLALLCSLTMGCDVNERKTSVPWEMFDYRKTEQMPSDNDSSYSPPNSICISYNRIGDC